MLRKANGSLKEKKLIMEWKRLGLKRLRVGKGKDLQIRPSDSMRRCRRVNKGGIKKLKLKKKKLRGKFLPILSGEISSIRKKVNTIGEWRIIWEIMKVWRYTLIKKLIKFYKKLIKIWKVEEIWKKHSKWTRK